MGVKLCKVAVAGAKVVHWLTPRVEQSGLTWHDWGAGSRSKVKVQDTVIKFTAATIY